MAPKAIVPKNPGIVRVKPSFEIRLVNSGPSESLLSTCSRIGRNKAAVETITPTEIPQTKIRIIKFRFLSKAEQLFLLNICLFSSSTSSFPFLADLFLKRTRTKISRKSALGNDLIFLVKQFKNRIVQNGALKPHAKKIEKKKTYQKRYHQPKLIAPPDFY